MKMAAFGATFRSANPAIAGAVVWLRDGIPGISQEEAARFVGANFRLIKVTSDEQATAARPCSELPAAPISPAWRCSATTWRWRGLISGRPSRRLPSRLGTGQGYHLRAEDRGPDLRLDHPAGAGDVGARMMNRPHEVSNREASSVHRVVTISLRCSAIDTIGFVLARELDVTQKRKRVVLVSAPGLVQRATESTLASCPGVELVATVPGALSATSLLSRTRPDLLLLDATLADEELKALLGWVKVRYPEISCAALTASTRQRERVLGWGADVAIHRGDLTGQLQELLECCPD